MKILQIGCLPPPPGGVSVHVARLAHYLSIRGHQVSVVETIDRHLRKCAPAGVPCYTRMGILSGLHAPSLACDLFQANLIHLHTSATAGLARERALLRVLRVFHKPVVWTVHGGAFVQIISQREHADNFRDAARWAKCVVFVNERQKAAAEMTLGDKPGTNMLVIPAFIPPPDAPNDPPPAPRPRPGEPFRVLAMGSWMLTYGFDLALDALAKLQDVNVRLTLLAYDFGYADASWRSIHLARARHARLESRFTEESACNDVGMLYRTHHAFLRPTRTDGDAVSVREAMCFGLPVIASDAAPRPEGCLIHKANDAESLASCLRSLILSKDDMSSRPLGGPDRFAARLVSLYYNLVTQSADRID